MVFASKGIFTTKGNGTDRADARWPVMAEPHSTDIDITDHRAERAPWGHLDAASSTRLFHVSDVHFGAEDREALDWFAALVREERPNALIFTGDVTMRARAHEFEAACEWLEQFDMPVTVEVGNHDLPYYNPFRRFVTPYKRYRRLERLIERPLDIQGVAIVPLKTTARFQWRLDWSKGHISEGGLDRVVEAVKAVPADHLVFVAAHHPLLPVANAEGKGDTRRGPETLDALAKAGAHAVLSGHVHDPFDVTHEAHGREVRLIGAGTLSERTRETQPSFNEIRVSEGQFETLARYMR